YRIAHLPLRFDDDLGDDLGLPIEGDTLVTLDFAFPFYGTRYAEMYVDANGMVSFEAPYLSVHLRDFYENDLPKIAPYYRMLIPITAHQSGVFYKHEPDKATITWYRVREFFDDNLTNQNTFQLVLHRDGTIDFVYDRMEAYPINGNRGLRPGGTGLAVEWGRFAEPPTETITDALLPEGRTIRFEPDDEGSYRFTRLPARFEADLGEEVIFREGREVKVALDFAFPFFGEPWEEVHVNANGAVAFGGSFLRLGREFFSPFYDRFDALPMIAPLFVELVASEDGGVFYKRAADKATITWHRVLSSYAPYVNTVQLVLHESGIIDFTYEHVEVPVFAADRWGLYPGDGRPAVEAVRYLMETNSYPGTESVILTEHFGLYSELIYRRFVHAKMVPFVYVILASTLFILIFFPLLFRVSLIKPIGTLLQSVRRIDKGDLDVRVPVRVNDEIGVLADNFNRMTTSLRTAQTELRTYAEDLERLKNRLQAENTYLQAEIKLEHNFEHIITRSEVFKRVLRSVEQVAATDATVLILGESGTGKELLARAIHQLSPRSDRPLVKVNCAALPAELIESELFGHEKGAFTGAVSKKIGRFELADDGTIFLDEIGDLPLDLQAKLLRVLQEGEFERLGNPRTIAVDVRVIAATNRDLEKEKEKGCFREDLYYRLCVFPIQSPPLREHKEDIPLLVTHFVKIYSKKVGKQIEAIPHSVIEMLERYHWPGNVRELENVIERAVILSPGTKLVLGDWLPKAATASDGAGLCTLEENERRHIMKALALTGGRVSGDKGAANLLDINPNTLTSRMKKLGIKRKA
ncbi:MAG: sigma 54-interacting transcriptional regulator, partial [Rhodothermales bacterium]